MAWHGNVLPKVLQKKVFTFLVIAFRYLFVTVRRKPSKRKTKMGAWREVDGVRSGRGAKATWY